MSRLPAHKTRVLFVDRSRDEHELFAVRFRDHYGAPVTASSSAEALAELERGETELLVTELCLAEYDGYELVRRMRALPAEVGGAVPAVVATAWARPQDRSAAREAGFDAFVTKPYDVETLLKAIEGLVPSIEALRGLRARSRTRRAEIAELRARLVGRRPESEEERESLAVRQAEVTGRADPRLVLVEAAAGEYARSHLAGPVEELEVVSGVLLDERHESWVVCAVSAPELLFVEVVIGPGGEVEAHRLDPGIGR
jgi:CheY-like chemotaxis protein